MQRHTRFVIAVFTCAAASASLTRPACAQGTSGEGYVEDTNAITSNVKEGGMRGQNRVGMREVLVEHDTVRRTALVFYRGDQDIANYADPTAVVQESNAFPEKGFSYFSPFTPNVPGFVGDPRPRWGTCSKGAYFPPNGGMCSCGYTDSFMADKPDYCNVPAWWLVRQEYEVRKASDDRFKAQEFLYEWVDPSNKIHSCPERAVDTGIGEFSGGLADLGPLYGGDIRPMCVDFLGEPPECRRECDAEPVKVIGSPPPCNPTGHGANGEPTITLLHIGGTGSHYRRSDEDNSWFNDRGVINGWGVMGIAARTENKYDQVYAWPSWIADNANGYRGITKSVNAQVDMWSRPYVAVQNIFEELRNNCTPDSLGHAQQCIILVNSGSVPMLGYVLSRWNGAGRFSILEVWSEIGNEHGSSGARALWTLRGELAGLLTGEDGVGAMGQYQMPTFIRNLYDHDHTGTGASIVPAYHSGLQGDDYALFGTEEASRAWDGLVTVASACGARDVNFSPRPASTYDCPTTPDERFGWARDDAAVARMFKNRGLGSSPIGAGKEWVDNAGTQLAPVARQALPYGLRHLDGGKMPALCARWNPANGLPIAGFKTFRDSTGTQLPAAGCGRNGASWSSGSPESTDSCSCWDFPWFFRYQCSDGIDNDGDGKVDTGGYVAARGLGALPADDYCTGPDDACESRPGKQEIFDFCPLPFGISADNNFSNVSANQVPRQGDFTDSDWVPLADGIGKYCKNKEFECPPAVGGAPPTCLAVDAVLAGADCVNAGIRASEAAQVLKNTCADNNANGVYDGFGYSELGPGYNCGRCPGDNACK